MSEKIKVESMPTQRNRLDVATELTVQYFEDNRANSVEQVQEVFTRLYATARSVELLYDEDILKLVPEEVAALLQKRFS